METWSCFHYNRSFCSCLLLVFQLCAASAQYIGQIYPGFEASPMNWTRNDGEFLRSKNSAFGLRFFPSLEPSLFVLVVSHLSSDTSVWTANRGLLVTGTDKFVFGRNGNVYLENATNVVWSAKTSGRGTTSIELQDTGNLVVLGRNRSILWQSFSHPTDTLLSGQEFVEGMRLKSFPHYDKLFHYAEIKSGDLILYAGYRTPQVYWSMANDSRKVINNVKSKVVSACLVANSWNFYDQNQALVWQFIFTNNSNQNIIWAAILGQSGSISFLNLQSEKPVIHAAEGIPPPNSCSIPQACAPYSVCSFGGRCQCPLALHSYPNCKPPINFTCNSPNNSTELLRVGEKLNYFALAFAIPLLKSNLNGCKQACISNCSCLALFFDGSLGSCFLFDQIGSLQRSNLHSTGFVAYVKVSIDQDVGLNPRGGKTSKVPKHVVFVVIIAMATVLVIVSLLLLGLRFFRRKKKALESSQNSSEEDNFECVSSMPLRFSYNDLRYATKNFSIRLGQGGFGSVYHGMLPDGTQVAVKKLEDIGQGKKEFRAEVSIIGSIHHVNLVRLKGFCAERSHRLLVYEYMGKRSLDKWIFRNTEDHVLNWETRFNIALGTAKGLAYLHEDCDAKIVHCNIKPENILLDDNFLAKVSDFGMAKLMRRDQSHVFTAVRGTRGYLAPEWITKCGISDKSDVYSYGMVLLEIIGGRKNYNPEESPEKAHFPSYAFMMNEERKLTEILDSKLKIDENDERAIIALKVALWCIQADINLRPPMARVVQMLEGICAVPDPPTPSQTFSFFHSNILRSSSTEEGSSLVLTSCSCDTLLSNAQLSGPR